MNLEVELRVTDDETRHDVLLSPCLRGPGRSHHHARRIRPREERLRGEIGIYSRARDSSRLYQIDFYYHLHPCLSSPANMIAQ
jgi:hypothetical protein